ncbi:MAG: PKD domain-containing protein [Proteobacteria bacterium]|nr:PKD domain-containing protein [Pseudomonadota bacterium]
MERPGFIEPAAPGPVEPVVVDLASIAPGQFDPNNKYDRWLKGKVDFSKRNRIVSADKIKSLKAASRRMVPSFGVQDADDAGTATEPLAPSPAGGFDSIDYTECCGGGGNVPPDPEMAAGPDHLIAVVNVAFEIFDKSGNTLIDPTTFASFMGANRKCRNVFDPNALYDEEFDRFILGVDAGGGYYCAAVSQTSDPTGSWNIYAFKTASGSDFFDYPHAGVGRDAIYVGANIFGTFGFVEGRIYALDKTAMYAGQSAQYVTRGLGSTYDSSQPLNLHGWNQGSWPSSGPHYFLSDSNYNGRDYAIHSWADPFGANTFTLEGVVNLNAATGVTAGYPLDVPQSGGGTVDGGDWRPQDFEYQDGFGWTVMAIACDPGSGTVNCVRWAKIDLAAAAVVDAGVYASDGTYRSYADLAANACGDMAVGYTKSSSAMFPGISYTGRLFGDPAGELQPETELKAGEITYTAFDGSTYRWGDYTGMTIDPDGETFWYLGEYSKNTLTSDGLWGTYIGSFSFTSCVAGANQPPVADAGPDQTVTEDTDGFASVTLNGAGSTDDGGITNYAWTEGSATIATVATPTISLSVAGSPHNITLEVTDGESLTDTDVVVITVQAAVVGGTNPVVEGCNPSSGNTSRKYTVAVTGSNFQDGATVDFGERIAVQGVTFVDSFRLDVRIRVQNRAASRPREVTVTNPDSNFGSLAGCFTVN